MTTKATGTVFAATALVLLLALSSPTAALDVARMDMHIAALRHGMAEDGKLWALLVAGSNGYDNYRHQADICHAYQILHKNGLADENIVVMMYDDIANNIRNRMKGQIINEPNGPDVYAGVPKDYTTTDVTPQNFLNVLSGKDMSGKGSGKVIKSGPSDRIFLVFADHGAPGLLAFPTFDFVISQALHSKALMETLNTMAANKQFDRMVLYIEACESGSMFDGVLPNNTNIYAVTAASPFESSYACYYDKKLGVYLGDCFSNHWMEDTDQSDLQTETLEQQWERVRADTNTSVVCQYGDRSFLSQDLATYMSAPSRASKHMPAKTQHGPADPTDSRDIVLTTLQKRVVYAETALEKEALELELEAEKNMRKTMDKIYAPVVKAATLARIKGAPPCNDSHCYDECTHAAMLTPEQCYWQCCEGQKSCTSDAPPPQSYCITNVWDTLIRGCTSVSHVVNDYSMKFGRPLARLCALEGRNRVLERVLSEMLGVCATL